VNGFAYLSGGRFAGVALTIEVVRELPLADACNVLQSELWIVSKKVSSHHKPQLTMLQKVNKSLYLQAQLSFKF
jgi:hypothetical protein